jgi:hypothetical protein
MPPSNVAKTISKARPSGHSISSVLATWKREGPLVHEPTGIGALDRATDGGPVYGTRWYLSGAPDAGKTALLVHIAHAYADRGIAVGLLAVDEEPGDIVTRFAQRTGFTRRQCERRDEDDLERIDAALARLPLRLYSSEWTIEAAARDLAAYAVEQGTGAMLGIDSVQTVRCDAETGAELSPQASVDARAFAIRKLAHEHRLIAIATSEMARAAYRSKQTRDNIDPMAASKWSGAIEYQARVLVSLRSVKDHPDLIELELPKNKHRVGPAESIYLEIDRASQRLDASDYVPPVSESAEGKAAAKAAEREEKVEAAIPRLLSALVQAHTPITSQAALKAMVSGSGALRAEVVGACMGRGLIAKDETGAYRIVHREAE